MLSSWLARALANGLGHLSPETLGRVAASLGDCAYLLGIRRRVTLENLRVAFPDLAERGVRGIARGAYRNMLRAFLEGIAAQRLTDSEVAERVVVENAHLLDAALAQGKGMLIATAHFGSWELLGDLMSRRGFRLNAVVRPLKGALNAQLIAGRQKNGIQLIPPRGALRGALKALARNEVVVMLIDQVLPAKEGVFVPFFGRLASTNAALSWAALRTGAPTLVVMGAREEGRLRMFVEGPFPISEGERTQSVVAHTAALTAAIERTIRRYPDQWLWLHRRWKVRPPV